MFFSDDLLTTKSGSLGIIWLVATLGPRSKRVTKKAITGVEITSSCELIAEPPEPLALRLTGHLLVGVARIYHRNFETFYGEVQNLHLLLRRATAVDGGGGGGRGQGTGLDLPNGGTSRFEQITNARIGSEEPLDLLDFGVDNIDWTNLDREPPPHSASTKLSSLAFSSQQSHQHNGNAYASDDESDGGLGEVGRKRRRTRANTRRHTNDAMRSRLSTDRGGSMQPGGGLDATGLSDFMTIDLGLLNDPMEEHSLGSVLSSGNMPAHSQSSGDGAGGGDVGSMGRDAGAEGEAGVEGELGDMLGLMDLDIFDEAPRTPPRTDGQHGASKRKEPGSGSGSEHSVPEPTPKATKTRKRTKKARPAFDQYLELGSDVDQAAYEKQMAGSARAHRKKKNAEAAQAGAAVLVNGGGLWVTFLEPHMARFLGNIGNPGKFQWEKDAEARRASAKTQNPEEPDEPQGGEGNVEAVGDLHAGRQGEGACIEGDPFGGLDRIDPLAGAPDGMQIEVELGGGAEGSYSIQQLSGAGANSLNLGAVQTPPRGGESDNNFEVARAGLSRLSQQSQLPWEDIDFDDDFGPDILYSASSVTPVSRRFSIMTPLEKAIRSGGARAFTGANGRRAVQRSRSGSMASGAPEEALMLAAARAGESDDEAVRPPANPFAPVLLAALEPQCRRFFMSVEKTMIAAASDEVTLQDMFPPSTAKNVAAAAFYNCLSVLAGRAELTPALATKRIFVLKQEETFGDIAIRIAVPRTGDDDTGSVL